MFEKLVKMQILQTCGFFVSSYAAGNLGMFWLGMTLTGSRPIDPFAFAPSIVFLTISVLVWVKALHVLMTRSLCAPESTLMMTLPVSEEALVGSKVFTATVGSFLVYVFLGGLLVYWTMMDITMDVQLTSIAMQFIDLGYPAWIAGVSVGLVPLLVLIEQITFAGLLLLVTLLLRNHHKLRKYTGPMFLVIVLLQMGFNIWLFINYEAFIGRVHPLALGLSLFAGFMGIAVLLYKLCVRQLKYNYMA